MSSENIAAVFAAEGLPPSLNHLLLAYADLSDAFGYCPNASVERMMAMTGMSGSTVTRTNKELEARNLLRRQRRTRSDGSTDVSIYRINLTKLASMRPTEPRWFDDNAMAGLGFDDEHPTTPDIRVPEIAPTSATVKVTGGLTCASVKMTPPPVDNSEEGEPNRQNDGWADLRNRQNDTPREEEVINPPPTPSVANVVSAEAIEESGTRFVAELPAAVRAHLNALHQSRLARLIGPALHAGHDPEALAQFLATELGGTQSVYAVMKHRLTVDLPRTPLAPLPEVRASETALAQPRCPEHPGHGRRADGECGGCFSERIAAL